MEDAASSAITSTRRPWLVRPVLPIAQNVQIRRIVESAFRVFSGQMEDAVPVAPSTTQRLDNALNAVQIALVAMIRTPAVTARTAPILKTKHAADWVPITVGGTPAA